MSGSATPRAIVTIERPGFTDGQALVKYDSRNTPRLIKEVDVELVTDASSQGKLRVFDPHYRVIDAFSDVTAKAIFRIYLGYGDDLGEPVFKGILAGIEREQKDTIFTCFDMAFVMKLEKKAAYKNGKTRLAIIRELVERNGLKFEGPETPLKLEPEKVTMQDEQTDWEHVLELAHHDGLKIFVRHDTVFAKYPAKVGTPIMTIKPPKDKDLLEGWMFGYDTLESQDGKPKVVTHQRRGKAGRRAEGKSNITAKAELSHLNFKQDIASPSKSKLSKRAQAQKELEREHPYKGRVEFLFPRSRKRPDYRDTVTLQAVGKLLSGGYICNTSNYNFCPGRLSMDLDLYRDINI